MASGPADPASLRRLGELVAPVSLAGEQRFPVGPGLASLLPGGGLGRGTTVTVGGPGGAVSLALALLAEASTAGAWTVVVGMGSLGLAAVAERGVALERLVLVDAPEPRAWASVVASLADAVDLVVVAPTHRVRPADARRLGARVRERGGVLVSVGERRAWPEGADLSLTAVHATWEGLGRGHGHLRARRVTVEAHGRRQAARPRRVDLWLPGPDGAVSVVADGPVGQLEPASPQIGAAS